MRLGKKFFSLSGHKPDTVFLWTALVLVLVGFLFLASASSDTGKIRFNDTYHFLEGQFLKGFLPGLLGCLVGYFIYYRKWQKVAFYLFVINIILLALIFTPLGYQANGSSRWISLGPLSFQPSELLKITFVLYIASLLSSSRIRSQVKSWKTYFIFVGVSALAGLLIFMQPATTTAVIILFSGCVMYFAGGAPPKHVVVSLIAGVCLIGALAAITPYRLNRVAPFWNKTVGTFIPSLALQSASTTGDSFHLTQSMIAIGNGGVTGVGFGKSTSKYSVLPEPMGDSIFAVIAEEFGFIGSVFIILIYALLIWRMLSVALRSHDDFAKLSLTGFSTVIALQTIIHIGANSGILPFTGVPLPFISYGGTSLAVLLTMMGITANISRYSSL